MKVRVQVSDWDDGRVDGSLKSEGFEREICRNKFVKLNMNEEMIKVFKAFNSVMKN